MGEEARRDRDTVRGKNRRKGVIRFCSQQGGNKKEEVGNRLGRRKINWFKKRAPRLTSTPGGLKKKKKKKGRNWNLEKRRRGSPNIAFPTRRGGERERDRSGEFSLNDLGRKRDNKGGWCLFCCCGGGGCGFVVVFWGGLWGGWFGLVRRGAGEESLTKEGRWKSISSRGGNFLGRAGGSYYMSPQYLVVIFKSKRGIGEGRGIGWDA